MKETIVNKAVHIDQDMREIAQEVNKPISKADFDAIKMWKEQLLEDVLKFCEALDETYDKG